MPQNGDYLDMRVASQIRCAIFEQFSLFGLQSSYFIILLEEKDID